MSTRSTIFYEDDLKAIDGKEHPDFHLYIELLDDTVCLEIVRPGVCIDVEIMTVEEWKSLGMPLELPRK